MRFRPWFLAAISLIVLVAACAPTPQIRNEEFLPDTSFLTGEPCGPPCWRGITPGETGWDEALTIVEDDPTLTDLETQADEDTGRIGAIWAPEDGQRCCQMITEDGETVSFLILQTAPGATLEQVLDEHGEPNYLTGETLTEDQGLVSLFYENIPMLVYAFVAGEQGEVTPSSEVVGFAYMTPDLMDLLIDTGELHTWDGYQSFQAYIDSELEVTPRITLTPTPSDE